MTKQEQIYNWLTIGITQSENRLSEIFYFDKRDNEFFSILITDYFMFDEEDDKLIIADNVTVNYSSKTIETLTNRINRIEEKDVNILSLPRLGAMSENDSLEKIEEFLQTNKINIITASIWEAEESGDITIEL